MPATYNVSEFVSMSRARRIAYLARLSDRQKAELFVATSNFALNAAKRPGVGSWFSKLLGQAKEAVGDIIAVAGPIVSSLVPGAAPIVAAVNAIASGGSKPAPAPAAPAAPQPAPAAPQTAQATSSGSGGGGMGILILGGLAVLALAGGKRRR